MSYITQIINDYESTIITKLTNEIDWLGFYIQQLEESQDSGDDLNKEYVKEEMIYLLSTRHELTRALDRIKRNHRIFNNKLKDIESINE